MLNRATGARHIEFSVALPHALSSCYANSRPAKAYYFHFPFCSFLHSSLLSSWYGTHASVFAAKLETLTCSDSVSNEAGS